ncbi:hypothetical protein H7F15_15865 [Pontibacter sp. Tf4]|uniref:DUF3108 domain-containing protein n=1 Tax=Pontibacter sp. Tf4 TaxID=2761620 RepID=UPI00162A3173|nr:hypothetical protein [Pontibacter sp. Tf4]MBB6612522.1 hypothetical protein [Pontibacter sp. Tf4]
MKKLLLLMLCGIMFSAAYAQPDTVRVTGKHINTKHLKPGTRQYLVTISNPKNPKVLTQSLWNRDVRFEQVQGRERMVIRQNWIGADTLSNRTIESVMEKDFTPIFHTSTSARGTAAFNFYPDKITAADTARTNPWRNFVMPVPEPTYNWELDLEFFESLPLKPNTVFLINFYHPGSKTGPQYYAYKVTGSEKLPTINNQTIDCWLLRIDYSPENYGIFWITKKSHEVLKMEEKFNGITRYKVKLGTIAGKYI